MLLDLVNRISSERKVQTSKFEYSLGPLGDGLRTSWGCPESTSQGRPLSVGLRRPLDVISGRPQDVGLGRPRDVRLGCPRHGQTGSLGDVLGTLEGTSSGRPGDQYLLAGEFLTNNGLMKQSYNNHGVSENYHKTVYWSVVILECISANPVRGFAPTKDRFFQSLALTESNLKIFLKNGLLYNLFSRILRLLMEAPTCHNMVLSRMYTFSLFIFTSVKCINCFSFP